MATVLWFVIACLVEVVGREPAAAVRTSFGVLAIDDAGCVDASRPLPGHLA